MLVACSHTQRKREEGGREGGRGTNLIHLPLEGAKHLVALRECHLKLLKLVRVERELPPQLCLLLRQLLTASLLLQTLPQQLQVSHHHPITLSHFPSHTITTSHSLLLSHSVTVSHYHHSHTITTLTPSPLPPRSSPDVSLAG